MPTIKPHSATVQTLPVDRATSPERVSPPAPPAGLEGVVAADTRLSRVDGDAGVLTLAGYPIEELAGRVPWESALHLLWWDRLPDEAELACMRATMADARCLGSVTLGALRAAVAREPEPVATSAEGALTGLSPIDAMILACATLPAMDARDVPVAPRAVDGGQEASADWTNALRLAAALPVALAAYVRLRAGREPLPPRAELGLAANLLWQLHGEFPSAARERALDTYLVTTADHGLNASTFTARVIASTGAAPHAALAGAIGALSGWRHGGAPGPVLAMLEAIGRPEQARPWITDRLAAGDRIMGFGHRVYRVRDPRAAVLSAALARLRASEPPTPAQASRADLAETVEREASAAIALAKPGRAIHTNVEFYTAILLDALGIEAELFTPLFAVARSAGWLAHAREAADGRLVRPRARYVGAIGRTNPSPPEAQA